MTLTVAAIVMWSALVSSFLPLVLKKIRIDPAVVSAPMIATIVDGTGLMIYFVIAHATLRSARRPVNGGFGMPAGWVTVVDVQRVLLLGSRDGV